MNSLLILVLRGVWAISCIIGAGFLGYGHAWLVLPWIDESLGTIWGMFVSFVTVLPAALLYIGIFIWGDGWLYSRIGHPRQEVNAR